MNPRSASTAPSDTKKSNNRLRGSRVWRFWGISGRIHSVTRFTKPFAHIRPNRGVLEPCYPSSASGGVRPCAVALQPTLHEPHQPPARSLIRPSPSSAELLICLRLGYPGQHALTELQRSGHPGVVSSGIEAHRTYRKLLSRRPSDGDRVLLTAVASPAFLSEEYWRQDLRGSDDWLYGHVFKVTLVWRALEPLHTVESRQRAEPILATTMIVR